MPATRTDSSTPASGHDATDRDDAVFVTDRDGTIVEVNDAFEELTGWSRREAVGNTPRLLRSGVHGDEVYLDLWHTIQAGAVWEGELVDRRRDGTLRTHRVTITPLVDGTGRVSRFVAVERDLTAELDREVPTGGAGHAHTDPDGRCLYADVRAGRLLDLRRSDVLGDGLLGALERGDAHEVHEVIGMTIDSGREHRVDVRAPGGGWLRLTVGRLQSDSGALIGARLDLEDISERVSATATDEAGALPAALGGTDRPGQGRSTRQSASRRSSRAPRTSSAS